MSDQQKFEVWAVTEHGLDIEKTEAGVYVDETTFIAWEAWRQSAAEAKREQVSLGSDENAIDGA